MKKGPLSNLEKKYIDENIGSTPLTVVATALDRSTSLVKKYVDMSTKAEKPTGNTGKMFARNEDRGVTIMTQNASMASDESKTARKEAANGVPRYQKFIHKIKD